MAPRLMRPDYSLLLRLIAVLATISMASAHLGCSDSDAGASSNHCQGTLTFDVDEPPARLSDDYEFSCAACHGSDGQGRDDYPSLHDVDNFQAFVQAVREGSSEGMPAYGADTIDEETLAKDFSYLQETTGTLTLDCGQLDEPWTEASSDEALSDDEIYERGMEAWRRAHPEGACVNCHAMDATDLAFFDYDEASILRRGLGQGASQQDMWAIVDLVDLQRERNEFDPINPRRYNFLQPCGEVLPGDTQLERERSFWEYLADRDHPYIGDRITSHEEADSVMEELVSWDLREVCLGFELAPWTGDSFRGPEFHTINDWIPDFPTIPKEEYVDDWYDLHDAYIEDPSPDNLWAVLDQMEEMTIREERQSSEGHPWTIDNALGRSKYQSVQAAAHMMRNHTANRPDPGWENAEGLRGGTNDGTVQDFFRATHDRTSFMWDVGAAMGSGAMPHPSANSGEWPEAVADKVFLFPEDFRERVRAPFSHTWFYIGWMYDPALIFTAEANRQEYFRQHLIRFGDYYMHSAFLTSMTFAHVHYGKDTRFSIYSRLSTPLANGEVVDQFGRGMNGMGGPGFGNHPYFSSSDSDYPEDLAEKYREFVVNDFRARVYALEASLLRGHTTENVDARLDDFDDHYQTLEDYEDPEYWPALQEDLDRIRGLLEQAEGEATRTDEIDNTSMVYRGSHPEDMMPLEIPESALQRDKTPFGESYDQHCASCHGDYAQGHAGGGETAGKGLAFGGYPRLREYPNWGGFKAYVRHGITSDVVQMPAFSEDRISDDELRQIWEALNDPDKLSEVE